jgi:lysophospholipase L1-like esterase
MLGRSSSAVALLLVSCAALAQAPAWTGSWGASPLPPSEAAGPFPATPSFDNQTLRQIVRLSVGGERLRLRLTNEYGTQPLAIGAARVAVTGANGAIVSGTERVVTFAGKSTAVIAAGAPLLSDPIDLAVADLATIAVSVYFPTATGPCTCHATGMQDTFVSASGDFTAGTFTPVQTIQTRAFLSGVEVLTSAAGVVVALGDSITDGVGSTSGANRRWPDLLAERLAARSRGGRFGVVNHGISGNRLLNGGAGESALARFDRDVLSVPRVTHVIVFVGVNDLGFAYGRFEGPLAAMRNLIPPGAPATTETMIAGYRQLISRAHGAGLKIYGATIAPYEGAMYFSAEGESARQAINSWIRENRELDGVLDFDAVLRDRAKPAKIADGLHSGDFLHGSDAGYRALADSIDLSLFTGGATR